MLPQNCITVMPLGSFLTALYKNIAHKIAHGATPLLRCKIQHANNEKRTQIKMNTQIL